jgi:hypothetical protein
MAGLSRYITITPVGGAGQAAAVYVPLLLATRGLAFVRLLVVAWLLGEAGKREFGLYPPALELTNLLVPLVLLGLSDVAERYASRFEHEGRLGPFLGWQMRRVVGTGLTLLVLLTLLSPLAWKWFAAGATDPLSARYAGGLLIAVGANALVLALYQWMAAVLRGLRAYPAVAAMEGTAAVLLLASSAAGAWQGTALALLIAYGISNALPVAWYALALRRHVRRAAAGPAPPPAPDGPAPRLRRFAWFAWLRLLLVMAFGFVSTWGLLYLVRTRAGGLETSADFGMTYRIAQLIAYGGAAVWASAYGIAARAWAHGSQRRALVTMLTVGRVGGALLLLAAAALTLGRGLLGMFVHASYMPAIHALLPPLLGVFVWYALLGLLTLLGDLEERPWIGAAAWATATLVQATVIMEAARRGLGGAALWVVVAAGAAGVGAGLLVALGWLWSVRRRARLGGAVLFVAVAAGAFFVPAPWVTGAAGAVAVTAGTLLATTRRRGGRAWPVPLPRTRRQARR